MESSESPADGTELPDPPDWELLSALIAQHGAYRHRMGLRRADPREFYAPTSAGPAIQREKTAILDRSGDRHAVSTPDGHRAAVEFARCLGLPVNPGAANDSDADRDLVRQVSLAMEPDLMFVQPPDWSLVWASVCFPSNWSLEGKVLRPLASIHAAVPELNEELGRKIFAFFDRLPPGEGWRRANWGLSASARRNQHPNEPIPRLTAEYAPDKIFVRVEDQHLLKLPETGAIAFGIRIASYTWRHVAQRAEIAEPLLEKLRSMSTQVAKYKSIIGVLTAMTEKY